MTTHKRILIKLSGEALSNSSSLFDKSNLSNLVDQIKFLLSKKAQIAIVVGGGNIWRGKEAEALNITRTDADYMGMMATIINAIALRNVLENSKIATKTYSAFEVEGVISKFDSKKARGALNKNKVVLLAAGTGLPFFTTDTTAALRASELDCDAIYMAKNGVDGVYNSDPKVSKSAKLYSKISFDEVYEKQLKVMDLTAITLCKQNKIDVVVYNGSKQNSLINAYTNKKGFLFTKIS